MNRLTIEEQLQLMNEGKSPVLLRKDLFVVGTFEGTTGSQDEGGVLYIDGYRRALEIQNKESEK